MIRDPNPSARPRTNALRRYPALAFLGVAAVLAVALPSALTLPNAGPPTLAEFAPVPGHGAGQGGDLGRLGSGSGDGLGLGPGDGPPQSDTGSPGQPGGSFKRCVGNPPRQTEDPLSPPCVAFFDGENFGRTAPGVTPDEVRVLVVYEVNSQCSTSRGCENGPPDHQVVDINEPGEFADFVWIRTLANYQRYFNDRFQTYDRLVHFYAYVVDVVDESPANRRAEARAAIDEVDPFAVITYIGANSEPFLLEAASRNILAFPGSDAFSAIGQRASFYRRHPGRVWSYRPSLEQLAHLYTGHVCRAVVGHRVSFSGMSDHRGRRRSLGLLWGNHPERPDLSHFKDLVRDGVEACGGRIDHEEFFEPDRNVGQPDPNVPTAIARFSQREITTILWAGGVSQDVTRSMASLDYRPEIVVAGDGHLDGTAQGQLFMDQSVWQHARAVSIYAYNPPAHERICVQAALEANPRETASDIDRFSCRWYPDLRQLFIGIQVAGPRLTPDTMDTGFHAIPARASTDRTVPACFYRPADHTCVKDAVAEWWDPQGMNRNGTVGCWRMMQRGERFLASRWPDRDVETLRTSGDPCNLQNFHPAG